MKSVVVCCLAMALCTVAPLSAQPAGERAPEVKPAIDGMLDLFKDKPVVALGDYHGLAQEEVFYSTLIRDPRFARGRWQRVGGVRRRGLAGHHRPLRRR